MSRLIDVRLALHTMNESAFSKPTLYIGGSLAQKGEVRVKEREALAE